MKVGIGFSENPDSRKAGAHVAQMALRQTGKNQPCDLALLFSTSRHNSQILRESVADIIGYSCPIYGGGAPGIITNQKFGYGGYQVGLACIWTDDCECNVIVEKGLVESEVATGARLGDKMAALGTSTNSQGIMFYDAIDRTSVPGRLLVATRILRGIKDRLGFLPNLVGAGLQGDHNSTPAKQFLGSEIGEHSTMLLNFSNNIQIDYSIMHGCRPATPYYTVTKAQDSTILEIEYEPALLFLDNLLGPILTSDDYPFFLIFGINHGSNPNEYQEENYANRLCFAIDKNRNGIIMFEPDMVEGTKFQIMARSLNLDYMPPKIEKLFTEVEAQNREIVLALYLSPQTTN